MKTKTNPNLELNNSGTNARGCCPLPAFLISKWIAALLVAITIMLPACATFNGESQTLRRVQTASQLAAYVGASEYLRQHPASRPAFETARAQLLQIEGSEHVDLALLLSIVNQLPVKELKSDRAQMIITAATIILNDYAGSLPLEKLDNLKPVARALREGLDLALAQQ